MRNNSYIALACALICGWPLLLVAVTHAIRSWGLPVRWNDNWQVPWKRKSQAAPIILNRAGPQKSEAIKPSEATGD